MSDERAVTHRLVLVRHAKSDYPPGVADHDRPLNARGGRDAPFIGSWIRGHVPWPEDGAPLVVVSTARRAQLTWALARNGLDDRWRESEQRDEPLVYAASARTLREVVAGLPEESGTVILVGHNPGLPDLIWSLCPAGEAFEQAVQKFPTSSIAVLETTRPWAEAAQAAQAFYVTQFAVARADPRYPA